MRPRLLDVPGLFLTWTFLWAPVPMDLLERDDLLAAVPLAFGAWYGFRFIVWLLWLAVAVDESLKVDKDGET